MLNTVRYVAGTKNFFTMFFNKLHPSITSSRRKSSFVTQLNNTEK